MTRVHRLCWLPFFLASPVFAEPLDEGSLPDEAGYAVSTLDSRVARLEKRLQGQPLTELSRDMDRLRDDVRKLRGTAEELKNALDRLGRLEGEHYSALERRQNDLEARLSGPPVAGSVTPPLPGPGAPSNSPPGAPVPNFGTVTPTPAPVSAVDQALSMPPVASAPAVDPKVRQKAYEHAFETLKAGKYSEAVAEFQAFVTQYPRGDFSDNAQYWLGEAHYVNRAFAAAREAFKKMINDFPQSTKLADAKLKLGFIEYENQQFAKARELLGEVVKQYPDTSAAKMAEKRLERMQQEKH